MIENLSRVIGLSALLASLGVIGSAIYAVLVNHNVQVYQENSLLENSQAAVLAIACIFFLACLFDRSRENKLIIGMWALLCYASFLRELDVERLNVHEFFIFIGSGAGRNILVGVLFLSILAYGFYRFADYKPKLVAFFKSYAGCLMLLGFTMMLIGAVFENLSSVPHHELAEEICELAGFLFVMYASLMVFTESFGVSRSA